MLGEFMIFWFWWMVALAFLVVELLVTGFFFIWLAASAFVVGLVLLLVTTLGFNVQILMFSILAVALLLIWRRYAAGRRLPASDHPLLNQRGAQYIGRTFDLETPIVNGKGRIKADGTLWLVEGPDSPAGAKVRIVAAKGTILVVAPASATGDWE